MSDNRPRIGVDFDNTIACYDEVFHRTAASRGWVPQSPVLSKSEVRDFLRAQGKEDDWIELQGHAYGPGLKQVVSFPGAKECLRKLRVAGASVFIISHKTRIPYRGEPWDLHSAAREWLEHHGFFDPFQVGLDPTEVFFELSLERKLARIRERACDIFVDDLPELLEEPSFPSVTNRILFDPGHKFPDVALERIHSWRDLQDRILTGN